MTKSSRVETHPEISGWEICERAVTVGLLFVGVIFCLWILLNRVAFDTYSFWDDEGYFVLMLRHFLDAGGLYVKTYSQYGPFFTLAESTIHRLFQLPVDLDGARILTVSYILSSAVLLTVFVGRLTRKLELALPCFVLSVMITVPILDEPGHPQGLIAALTSIALCMSLLVGTTHETLGLVLLGAIAGALLLTKINVGLFFCFALGLPLILMLVKGSFRSPILGLFVAASVCLPAALMAASLRTWAWSFCLYMLMSFMALYAGAFQSGTPNVLRPIRIWCPIAGCVVIVVPILIWAVMTGSTPLSLVSGILLRPLGQPRLFAIPRMIPGWQLMLLMLPVVALAAIPWARRKFANVDLWLSLAKVAIALGAAAAFLWGPDHGMFYALTFLPVLLIPACGAPLHASGVFPRLFLVSLVEFEMLQSYPVLGSSHHDALTSLGAWICLLLYDGCSALASLNHPAGFRPSVFRSPVTLGALCVVLTMPVLSWYFEEAPAQFGNVALHHRQILTRWLKGQPLPPRYALLALPGARLVRMPTAAASVYRRLSAELHANCDMLFTMPGMGSLNVWSETQPPNGFNLTGWMLGITPQEQKAIRTKLEHAERPCVVYNPELTRWWMPPGMQVDPKAPMVEYVLKETKTVDSVGNYQIRMPYTRRAPWR